MSNWRDRTERDAMVKGTAYQKPIETPISKNNIWMILNALALGVSLISLIFAGFSFFGLRNSSSGSGQDNSKSISEVKAVCLKDDQGNFKTAISSEGINRSVIIWNSEVRCMEATAMLNKQISLDSKDQKSIDNIVRIILLNEEDEVPLSNVELVVNSDDSSRSYTIFSDTNGYAELKISSAIKEIEFRKEGYDKKRLFFDANTSLRQAQKIYLARLKDDKSKIQDKSKK